MYEHKCKHAQTNKPNQPNKCTQNKMRTIISFIFIISLCCCYLFQSYYRFFFRSLCRFLLILCSYVWKFDCFALLLFTECNMDPLGTICIMRYHKHFFFLKLELQVIRSLTNTIHLTNTRYRLDV